MTTGLLLQDWTTIRMQFGQLSFIQGEVDWLDMEGYQDAAFWLEVRAATFATGVTSFTIQYETAPMKDESLFVNMVSSASISGALATPNITKSIFATTTNPLARWLRWKLVPNAGGSAGVSDITFRIAVAANSAGMAGRK